jgi:C4-dicarboxylate transporter, DctQ subunit
MDAVMSAEGDEIDRWKARLLHAGTAISNFGLAFAAIALLAITILNGINVVMRYFFLSAISWAEEIMLYLMIYGVFLGAVSVTWQDAHIKIDTVIDAAPAKWRQTFRHISTLVGLAILIPVIWASAQAVMVLLMLDERSDATNTPMWIPQIVVPVSLSLIVVMSLLRIYVGGGSGADATHDEFDRV